MYFDLLSILFSDILGMDYTLPKSALVANLLKVFFQIVPVIKIYKNVIMLLNECDSCFINNVVPLFIKCTCF